MSRLVLWRLPSSPPSQAVIMLGNILGIQLELKAPDYLTMEHKSPGFLKVVSPSPDWVTAIHASELILGPAVFLTIFSFTVELVIKNYLNPMGTVPVLEDGDFVISESHTIMKYLLTKYGAEHQERLYPSEAKARALVDQALFFDTGVMFISLKNVAKPTILQGLPGPTQQHLDHIEESYGTLEMYLENTTYVAANRLTLADLSLGSTVTALQGIHKLNAEKYPRTADWLSRIESESFFKTINAPGAASLAKTLSICWEKNKKNVKV